MSVKERGAEEALQGALQTKFPVLNWIVLLKKIGHGVYDNVHLALSLHTKQPGAVKIIRKAHECRTVSSKRIQHETTSM